MSEDVSTTTVPARRHADMTDVSTPHVNADITDLAASKLTGHLAAIKTVADAADANAGLRDAEKVYFVSENVYLYGATTGTFTHVVVDTCFAPTGSHYLRNTSTNLNDDANFPIDLEGGTYTITVCLSNAAAASDWAFNIDAEAAFVTVVGDAGSDHKVATTGVAITRGAHTLHIKNVNDTGAGTAQFYSVAFKRTGA